MDSADGTVGLVPTMGSFHDGHVALFRAAREENDVVVVSLFVNPAQFDEERDLAAYPREEAHDAELAEGAGVDVLFLPTAEELYPDSYQTWVDVEQLGSVLEGDVRPGHFRGVATICLKLFNLVRPQRAYFGQKDAQQTAVVRRLVRDLNVPVEIRVVPTVRDEDGLALSSRNAQLSPDEHERALALPRALATRDPSRARELLDGLDVDYVEVADFEPKVLAAAVRVGSTRLIDNVVLEGDPDMTSHPNPSTKVSLTELADRKSRGEKLVMVTAYDHPGGRRRHHPRRRLRRGQCPRLRH
ncbi:MAG TPA: pantoate--beta-alanine ligase, partial [Gaiellaceae bacterium]|nr:pantoate--beta-alanine ligase [Gaiellaceae bacterium]